MNMSMLVATLFAATVALPTVPEHAVLVETFGLPCDGFVEYYDVNPADRDGAEYTVVIRQSDNRLLAIIEWEEGYGSAFKSAVTLFTGDTPEVFMSANALRVAYGTLCEIVRKSAQRGFKP